MPKYVVNQSTKSGKIITSAGDNQHIVINQVHVGRGKMAPPPVPPMPVSAPGENEEDIIQAIGPGAKVFINGKRVK
jgi:hypothetical protein